MTLAGETDGAERTTAPAGLPGLLDELQWRGMLHQHSRGLAERLATGRPIKGYNGFDPRVRRSTSATSSPYSA